MERPPLSNTSPETTRLALRVAIFIDILIGVAFLVVYFAVSRNVAFGITGGALIGSAVILLAIVSIAMPAPSHRRRAEDEIPPPQDEA